MPVTKSAQKKLRVDRRRQEVNKRIRTRMKRAIKTAKKEGSQERVREAYSAVDRARKKGIIKKNKAARLKSRLVKWIEKQFGKKVFGK